jgi:transcriptional regulator with XRE-family HTH domain
MLEERGILFCEPIQFLPLIAGRLLQKQVAEQIGVNGATITNWERNTSTPVIRHLPAIIRFLGYDPTPPPSSLPERLTAARRKLGLTQREMARRLGVDPSTLLGWEAGDHRPTNSSLEMIGRFHEHQGRGPT